MKLAAYGFAHGHAYRMIDHFLMCDGVVLTGIAEPDETFAIQARERYPAVPLFSSLEELLEETSADCISIASINSHRAEAIIKCLNAGKHVFVDKPLVTTIEQLEEVEKAVGDSGKQLGLYLTLRFAPHIAAIKKVMETGELGVLTSLMCFLPHSLQEETRPAWMFNSELYGGIINDIAIHLIDLVRYFTADEIIEVTACSSNQGHSHHGDFEDNGQVMLRTGSGTAAQVSVSWLVPDTGNNAGEFLWIEGTNGRIELSSDPLGAYTNKIMLVTADKVRQIKKADVDEGMLIGEFVSNMKNSSCRILDNNEIIKSTRTALMAQRAAKEGKTIFLETARWACLT